MTVLRKVLLIDPTTVYGKVLTDLWPTVQAAYEVFRLRLDEAHELVEAFRKLNKKTDSAVSSKAAEVALSQSKSLEVIGILAGVLFLEITKGRNVAPMLANMKGDFSIEAIDKEAHSIATSPLGSHLVETIQRTIATLIRSAVIGSLKEKMSPEAFEAVKQEKPERSKLTWLSL